MSAPRRLAVVLFNLGGPDGPGSVRPFLQNLFSDPAIIGAPGFVRLPLAAFIAKTREKSAIANYARMGGGSPLLPETRQQAQALEAALAERLPGCEIRTFIAMRYWGPSTAAAAEAVKAFAPDEVVLAPLYPQYSTTTTGSSLKAWREVSDIPARTICCWYGNEGLLQAHADRIRATWEAAGKPKVRLLFSAHGLPERVIKGGDPYQWQVEQTCAGVAARLGPEWDWTICYQSRVGPVKWIGPATPDAIAAAAAEGLGVLIDPIAFVSEHIETLVELDHDYAVLAQSLGVPVYLRAPAMGTLETFVSGLGEAIVKALGRPGCRPDGAACPAGYPRCGRSETGNAV